MDNDIVNEQLTDLSAKYFSVHESDNMSLKLVDNEQKYALSCLQMHWNQYNSVPVNLLRSYKHEWTVFLKRIVWTHLSDACNFKC